LDVSDKRLRREMGKSCACFNLRRAARLVTQRFDRAFRDAGITANQFSILMATYNQEGILLTQLARILGTERTTLSRNVSLNSLFRIRASVMTLKTGTGLVDMGRFRIRALRTALVERMLKGEKIWVQDVTGA
jgi:hypothetical protein